jgi:hypothetical protein
VRSSKGNWYIMVCYVFDCNYVNIVPMKSRSASEWVKAYDHIHQELTSKVFKPKLQNPELPFAQVGDDTIEALTKLAKIFKNKFQKVQAPGLSNAPAKTAENKSPADLSQPILTSPVQQQYQTRSQTIINAKDTTNAPLLPRVVTPMTGWVAPPRVPSRSQNLSLRNLSQDDFWDIESANMAIALGTRHWSQQHCANAVIHPVTGKEMEYTALMKDPNLQPLWK